MIDYYKMYNNILKIITEDQSNIKNYDVSYIYGNDQSILHLSDEYGIDIKEILKSDDEVRMDSIKLHKQSKKILVNFLIPKLQEELHLDNLVTSILFLIENNKIIIITNKKMPFIADSLKEIHVENISNFTNEIILNILENGLNIMLNDLRSLREKIDLLETNILDSGSIKPVFSNLLALQKYMISLSSTYETNKKVMSFLETSFINEDDEEVNNLFSDLYDKVDTMNRILSSYSQHLDNLETMINNMSAYQLNATMKTLTELSIVLTIPSIIYALWGINVHVPFENNKYGAFIVIAISLILSIVTGLHLRKKKYF